MAKEIMPAWQQVLLIALNNVPKAKTGHEAWEKLNAEEQSAVMDFLAEHCGEKAQAALEDACGKIQRPVWWRWPLCGLLWVAVAVAWLALVQWAEKLLDWELSPVFWALIALTNIHTGLIGSPFGKMQEMWKDRTCHDTKTIKRGKPVWGKYPGDDTGSCGPWLYQHQQDPEDHDRDVGRETEDQRGVRGKDPEEGSTYVKRIPGRSKDVLPEAEDLILG